MPTEKNKPFNDEQTDKRIHEHLKNENDLISNEDISNVKTSIDEGKPVDLTNEEEKLTGKEQDIANNEVKKDDGEDPRIETPWNILK